ncbi:MAG: hypothetical protein IE933_14985 [Sphingomonadales bacterium]|nr:hypothetical protein [Sphingomonadales bacterium]MBD3774030.1 hypothetical protein [Paracoccaceae bacterium]
MRGKIGIIAASVAMASAALAFAVPSHAGLFGLPKFKIEQSDDRFSTDGLTTYSGLYNRISKKSLAGGVHIDAKGVFVEPVAIRDRTSGKVVALSFFIHNEASFDTAYGAPLTFGNLQRITFITGEGAPIALDIAQGKTRWDDVSSYNSVTRSASRDITESGFADLTQDQYARIIHATALAVKIDGDKRSMVYETRDISKSFIPNLTEFYGKFGG